jgi:repressor LexA
MNIKIQMRFTEKQGQYLAFIYNYSKIHGRAPAEADLERYFKTTPPTIHQMILKLEKKGADHPSTWTAAIDPVVDIT